MASGHTKPSDEPTAEGLQAPSIESIVVDDGGVTDATHLFAVEATPQLSQTTTPSTPPIPHQTEPSLSPKPLLPSSQKEDQIPSSQKEDQIPSSQKEDQIPLPPIQTIPEPTGPVTRPKRVTRPPDWYGISKPQQNPHTRSHAPLSSHSRRTRTKSAFSFPAISCKSWHSDGSHGSGLSLMKNVD